MWLHANASSMVHHVFSSGSNRQADSPSPTLQSLPTPFLLAPHPSREGVEFAYARERALLFSFIAQSVSGRKRGEQGGKLRSVVTNEQTQQAQFCFHRDPDAYLKTHFFC